MVELVTEDYALGIDERTGSLVRLHDRRLDVELISERRLAESFRLLLPTPQLEANYVVGTEQAPPEVERSERGIVISWNGPLLATSGEVDVEVQQRLEISDDGIESRLLVRNNSSFPLAEVWQPIVGGFNGIGPRKATRTMIPIAGWSADDNLLQNFRGNGWELGTPAPEYLFKYPGELPMAWAAFYNEELGGGLYIGCHDPTARFKVLRLWMSPGIAHLREDPWPRPEELEEGIAVGASLAWISFPYATTGETFESPPVLLRSFAGDWRAAASIYRKWFTSAFTLTDPRASQYRAQMAIQDTMFLLPEGTVTHTFREMGTWAQDAADHGVRSVMVSGWNRGGHDNQYPHYEPDERLGSWDELAAGVRECHKIGVKVYFFVNVQPIDSDTDWYRRELHRYCAMDPWGVSQPMGWGMGTVGARLGATRRSMVFASPAFPEFRSIITRQMQKLAEIGADGIHIDKLAWTTILLDFNPDLPLSPDQAPWQGILDSLAEILEACRKVNPQFSISVEGPWDRLLAYTDVAWVWHSTWLPDHVDAFKQTFSQWLPALAISQPYDFNVVNNAVRFGYQLLVGPGHYTASMAQPPMARLADYIREVLRIREELADTIFFGESLGRDEAVVEASDGVYYNVHRNPGTGARACVIVNLGSEPGYFTVSFAGDEDRPTTIHKPYELPTSQCQPVSGSVEAERLVIVVEAPGSTEPA